ncbi:MAG: glycerophosphodiester phosphodiesterase [Tunicatimonas sp.]
MPVRLLLGSALSLFSLVTYAQQTIDVQGHRGCRGLRPENTITAFIHALELGVTTLELDVVVSQDQQLVVSHEPFLSSTICTGPNGETITAAQEEQYNLYQMPYAQIRRCDCGSQENPRFPEQQATVASKPRLVDVIDAVEQYLRSHNRPPVQYNIETKSTPAGDGVFHPAPKEFVELLLAVLKEKDIEARTIVQSFDVRTLQEARRMAPELRQALLVENRRGAQENIDALGYVPEIYSPSFRLVNKKLRGYTRQQGMQLIPWTVNDRSDIRKMLDLGVDGIISDYPDRVLPLIND